MKENIFRSTWEDLEAKKPVPSRVNRIKIIPFMFDDTDGNLLIKTSP